MYDVNTQLLNSNKSMYVNSITSVGVKFVTASVSGLSDFFFCFF